MSIRRNSMRAMIALIGWMHVLRFVAGAETVQAISAWDFPSHSPKASPREARFETAFKAARSAGSVRIAETPDAILLGNDQVEIGFHRDRAGVSLASVRDARRRIELLASAPVALPFWNVQLLGPDDGISDFDSLAAGTPHVATAFDSSVNCAALELRWDSMSPGGAIKGSVDVAIQARLAAGDPYSRWRIRVDNHLENAALTRVDFPIVPRPGVAGKSDVGYRNGLFRAQAGEEIRDYLFMIQFLSVDSLYLGAYDPDHNDKLFRLRVGQEFRLQTLTPDAGERGVSYDQPYDFVIGTCGGDWFDAGQLYRQWAETQPWDQAPASDRPSVQRTRGVTAWLTVGHPLTLDPAAVVQKAMEFQEAIGAPIGIHWYNWSRKAYSPRMFPVRKGFGKAASEAEAAGIVVMPYVSMHYWTEGVESNGQRQIWPEFEEARPYACRGVPWLAQDQFEEEAFRLEEDHYIIKVRDFLDVPMCRLTDFWCDYLSQQLQRLRAESNCSAVYLDMAAVAPRWPCFDKTHGHPAGGGDHWARGNDKLMAALRQTVGPDVMLSGEGRYEGHIPWMDMDLAAGTQVEQLTCPIYDAVYAEQRLAFGAVDADQSDAGVACQMGLRWVYGQRPRVGPWILDSDRKGALEFLRRLCHLRPAAADCLDFGRMLRAPAWTRDPGRLLCQEWKKQKRSTPIDVELPAMERSAWRLPDGGIGICVVNLDTRPHAGELDLSPLVPANSAITSTRETWQDNSWRRLGETAFRDGRLTVDLPPRDARLYRLAH
ncbi:MAG: DUF6259 domain-containing protein [Candidatus Sumerlaeota bacterium]|nr:DUF6259 domain-containing protein [Candidatus Sumerlaeota bacterium]